ncbi:hypothetical protein BDW69DRAFT_163041 [Aspergillus filifer]
MNHPSHPDILGSHQTARRPHRMRERFHPLRKVQPGRRISHNSRLRPRRPIP